MKIKFHEKGDRAMAKVVIEMFEGTIVGIYGSEPLEVSIYEDIHTDSMTEMELDRLDEEFASVPYSYTPNRIPFEFEYHERR